MKRTGRWITAVMVVFALFAAIGCGDGKQPSSQGDQKNFETAVLAQNRLMQFFSGNHPQHSILKYAQADLDGDAIDDLIVIYRLSENKNQMCVVRTHKDHLVETNSVPAPVSDQMVQFKNIDDKPPLEFIVQGRKGAKVGYAIFRIEAGRLVDLFGDGMEDCC